LEQYHEILDAIYKFLRTFPYKSIKFKTCIANIEDPIQLCTLSGPFYKNKILFGPYYKNQY